MKRQFRYFPVSERQKDWGLYVTCAGHAHYTANAQFPSHDHPDEYFFSWDIGRTLHEWQLVHVSSGSGIVEFENGRFPVKAGTLIVLAPDRWHRYRPHRRTGWTTSWFGFGGEAAKPLMGPKFFKSGGDIRMVDNVPHFIQIFERTVEALLDSDSTAIFSAAARIPSVISTLLEADMESQSQIGRADIVHRAQSFIAEHATEVVNFEKLAEMLGIPYRTLRYTFAKEAETSLLQYQLSIRLARAKNLLRSSDMAISVIARTLGFNSPWHFAHFFHKKVGYSPAAYRNPLAARAADRQADLTARGTSR